MAEAPEWWTLFVGECILLVDAPPDPGHEAGGRLLNIVGASLAGIARWWTLFRVQVASRGWPVVERTVGVVADEWLRRFISQ